jgi:hypothetical protein
MKANLLEILEQKLSDPLNMKKDYDQTSDYFHKFSEIQLHPEEKLKLEQEYYTKQLLTQNQPNETL